MTRVLTLTLLALAAGCASGEGQRLLLNPDAPAFERRAPDLSHVRLETTKGHIVLEMRREWAPHGVDRFSNLVRAGFGRAKTHRLVRAYPIA